MPGYDVKFGGRISGNPFPEIAWLKDGKPLDTTSDKYKVKVDNDMMTFSVRDCDDKDVGVYSCVLKNSEGEDKCQAKLEVVDKP